MEPCVPIALRRLRHVEYFALFSRGDFASDAHSHHAAHDEPKSATGQGAAASAHSESFNSSNNKASSSFRYFFPNERACCVLELVLPATSPSQDEEKKSDEVTGHSSNTTTSTTTTDNNNNRERIIYRSEPVAPSRHPRFAPLSADVRSLIGSSVDRVTVRIVAEQLTPEYIQLMERGGCASSSSLLSSSSSSLLPVARWNAANNNNNNNNNNNEISSASAPAAAAATLSASKTPHGVGYTTYGDSEFKNESIAAASASAKLTRRRAASVRMINAAECTAAATKTAAATSTSSSTAAVESFFAADESSDEDDCATSHVNDNNTRSDERPSASGFLFTVSNSKHRKVMAEIPLVCSQLQWVAEHINDAAEQMRDRDLVVHPPVAVAAGQSSSSKQQPQQQQQQKSGSAASGNNNNINNNSSSSGSSNMMNKKKDALAVVNDEETTVVAAAATSSAEQNHQMMECLAVCSDGVFRVGTAAEQRAASSAAAAAAGTGKASFTEQLKRLSNNSTQRGSSSAAGGSGGGGGGGGGDGAGWDVVATTQEADKMEHSDVKSLITTTLTMHFAETVLRRRALLEKQRLVKNMEEQLRRKTVMTAPPTSVLVVAAAAAMSSSLVENEQGDESIRRQDEERFTAPSASASLMIAEQPQQPQQMQQVSIRQELTRDYRQVELDDLRRQIDANRSQLRQQQAVVEMLQEQLRGHKLTIDGRRRELVARSAHVAELKSTSAIDRDAAHVLEKQLRLCRIKILAGLRNIFPITTVAPHTICGFNIPANEPQNETHACALGCIVHAIATFCAVHGHAPLHPLLSYTSRSCVAEYVGAPPERVFPLYSTNAQEKEKSTRAVLLLRRVIAHAAFSINNQRQAADLPFGMALQKLLFNR